MDFSLEILKDLVSQGLRGEELIQEFELQSQEIKGAITSLIDDAEAIAFGEKTSASFDDIFRSE